MSSLKNKLRTLLIEALEKTNSQVLGGLNVDISKQSNKEKAQAENFIRLQATNESEALVKFTEDNILNRIVHLENISYGSPQTTVGTSISSLSIENRVSDLETAMILYPITSFKSPGSDAWGWGTEVLFDSSVPLTTYESSNLLVIQNSATTFNLCGYISVTAVGATDSLWADFELPAEIVTLNNWTTAPGAGVGSESSLTFRTNGTSPVMRVYLRKYPGEANTVNFNIYFNGAFIANDS